MLLAFLILSLVIVSFVAMAERRRTVQLLSGGFFALQLGLAFAVVPLHAGTTQFHFFTIDWLGILFFGVMALVSAVAFFQSHYYLDEETLYQLKLYDISLMLLCLAAAGVYFANNVAVTWIFLEATTLCAAGLVYHRRNARSLEATWKYVFVCSLGIAVAYLGILLLSTAVRDGELSYANLAVSIGQGNPLFLKIAFLFILVGYSCKMEIFPLYTIGVDANFAAPTPASAVISTVLVNAGFVAFFRVYRVMALSEVAFWFSRVLLVAGLLSVLIAAVYLRRTNNYKRFLAYSTVENIGIAVIGLGLGGAGTFAAILQVMIHSLLKSGMFIQLAQVGKLYGNYRINRLGSYMKLNPLGAGAILLGALSLLAFPPSALFISEMMIFSEMIATGAWGWLIVLVLLLCFVLYALCARILRLCLEPAVIPPVVRQRRISHSVTWLGLLLIVGASVLGLVQPLFFVGWIQSIIAF